MTTHTKYWFRRLGVLLASALTLTALLATSAQAEEVKMLGSTFKELEISKATASGELESEAALLVPSRNLELKCEGYDITEGVVFAGGTGQGYVLFLGCAAYELGGELIANCVLVNKGEVKAGGQLLLKLHGESFYVLAEPFEGQPFKVVQFVSGLGCVLPKSNPVQGKVAIEISQEEKVEHLVQAAPSQALYSASLLYGLNPVIVDGSGVVFLTGEHLGEPWGPTL